MPDLDVTRREHSDWEKHLILAAGTRIEIRVIRQGQQAETIYDRAIPAGKRFSARISVGGEVISGS